LVVTPGCLNLANGSTVNIQIKSRSINSPNSEISILESLPDDFILQGFIDDSITPTGLTYGSNDIGSAGIKKELKIKLQKVLGENSYQLYDEAIVELVKNGTDGNSAYVVDLSNDFDQVYVDNGKLIPNQTVSTDIYLYKGTERLNITSQNIDTTSLDEIVGNGKYANYELTNGDQGYVTLTLTFNPIAVNDSVKSLSEQFTIKYTDDKNQEI
jgi:hypothetical protein